MVVRRRVVRSSALLLLCCTCPRLSEGQVEVARLRPQEWDELVDFVREVNTGRALASGRELAGRRLFSYGMPDVDSMVSSATSWVESSAASVANKIMSLGDVANIFSNSSTWVQQGVAVANAAVSCMGDLAHRMYSIFTQFAPLKPIFASENGLMTLISQPNSTATLVHVVRELFNTSSVLQTLNEALHQVSEMFEEISDYFSNLLSRIGVKGRRLTSWTSLLEGIDFKAIVSALQSYLKPLADSTDSLLSVSGVLGPMMIKLDETFQGAQHAAGGNMNRRLVGVQDVLNLKANQEKYSSAIAQIIPAWQAVEKLGVKMCPTVALSQTSATSLKCRVSSFVKKSVGLDVGALTGMVKGCGGNSTGQASKAASDAKCPTASYAAGLPNVLGQSSNFLGLILAVVGALGLLGAGGAMAVKNLTGDNESESEGEEYSQGGEGSSTLLGGTAAE